MHVTKNYIILLTCTNILSVKSLVKIYQKLQWWRINQDGGTSSSLEAQINEWGALMLLSTVTSLMGKAGEETTYFLSRQKNWP